jgi:hypothetical protein
MVRVLRAALPALAIIALALAPFLDKPFTVEQFDLWELPVGEEKPAEVRE